MTFSIAACCEKTGQLGVALSSSSIAVGARCPWLLAGVGAVVSQNITLPSLGSEILQYLAQGLPPEQALQNVMLRHSFSEYRQVTVINHQGETAVFNGRQTLGIYHAMQGKNCVAAGNMLANKNVIISMVTTFESSTGQMAERLLAALQAAVNQGGEAGPVHSCAIKVTGRYSWAIVDLRVDWDDDDPIARLTQLWQAYAPQMHAYITRAIDPRDAPSYGVAGDE